VKLGSGGQQIDDLLDGFVGVVVDGFELAGRLMSGVGAVVEATVGEWAAEPFVKEQKEQRHLDPFRGQAVGAAGAVTLEEPVAPQFAQVVAELVEAVAAVGEVEGGEQGVVDVLGGPAADVTATMQEHFEQADDTGVVDLDAGIADRTDGDRQGEALQQREVNKDLGDLVGGQPPQPEFAAAFEEFVDGKVALEDEVAAILDLGDRVKARKTELLALLGGELRSQDQGPVVEPLADDARAQFVGGGLEAGDVVDREEGVIGLAEADLRPLQLLLDEAVAVEVIGGLEREERGHPHHHRAEDLIADVEIVVGEAAALVGKDPVIGILGGVFRHGDAKARSLLHALEDEVDAIGVVAGHAALPGQDMVFLAHPLCGPFDRHPVIAGEGVHPGLVVGRALPQDLFVDDRYADHLAEEVHHLLGPR